MHEDRGRRLDGGHVERRDLQQRGSGAQRLRRDHRGVRRGRCSDDGRCHDQLRASREKRGNVRHGLQQQRRPYSCVARCDAHGEAGAWSEPGVHAQVGDGDPGEPDSSYRSQRRESLRGLDRGRFGRLRD